MSKYYTAEKINQEIEKMIDMGYTPPTRLQRVQEGRKIIIVDNSLVGAGFIRTYDEAKRYFQRRYGKNQDYTLQEYEQSIKELNYYLRGGYEEGGEKALPELTFKQVEKKERERLKTMLEDLETVTGKKYDVNNYDVKKLHEAIKEAGQRVLNSHANSPKFYEYLSDILSEI